MNVPVHRSAEQTRNEILAVAWDLFRQLGSRATIADIAAKLGMSSGNIYRFFPSKQALSEAICASQLGALADAVAAAGQGPGPAAERIRAMMMTLHRGMSEQMLSESRVYEIVDVAMKEQWPAIDAFHQRCAAMMAERVAEGQALGEFGPGDPAHLGAQTLTACVAVFHPTLLAECPAELARTRPDEVIGFALRALARSNSN
jgi:AcrR family transcriptional regulator